MFNIPLKSDNQVPDQRFVDFISQHHVLTLATCEANQPYCCNCFYVYNQQKGYFVIKSGLKTRHTGELISNSLVAGSIVLESDTVGKIQGLQFMAKAVVVQDEMLDEAKSLYVDAFPYSALEPGVFTVLNLTFAKLTDNRLGFGKKISWTISNN